MNQVKWLPLEKIDNRPVIKAGNYYDLQRDVIPEILKLIFLNLDSQSLASCNLVCKQWCDITDHKPDNELLWNVVIAKEIHQNASFVFGKEEWFKYFGDIGIAPNYPRDICKILGSNCPFFEGQTVGKTHLFILVPETVNGNALTLNFLGELVKKPKEGQTTGYDENRCLPKVFEEHGKTAVKKAHWIMITNNVIPGSTDKTYAAQQQMINKYAHYNVPNALYAVLAVFIKCVIFGEYLLKRDPWTYTRCQEVVKFPVVVGGFSWSGLRVTHDHYGPTGLAVMACRRFGSADVLGSGSSNICALF